jgi:hypothetical protein
LFLYGTLELFRQCNIFLFFYVTLELFQQFGIIWFSIGLWNYSDSVDLFVFLLDIGTFPTVCGSICLSIRLWNCSILWHYLFLYTVPKPNRKPNNVTLSKQFQSPIDKQTTNNATLSEQFQSPIENQIMAHCQNSSIDP